MTGMARDSRELPWAYCTCCSFDTQSRRDRKRMARARRNVRRIARRSEERRWVREANENQECDRTRLAIVEWFAR